MLRPALCVGSVRFARPSFTAGKEGVRWLLFFQLFSAVCRLHFRSLDTALFDVCGFPRRSHPSGCLRQSVSLAPSSLGSLASPAMRGRRRLRNTTFRRRARLSSCSGLDRRRRLVGCSWWQAKAVPMAPGNQGAFGAAFAGAGGAEPPPRLDLSAKSRLRDGAFPQRRRSHHTRTVRRPAFGAEVGTTGRAECRAAHGAALFWGDAARWRALPSRGTKRGRARHGAVAVVRSCHTAAKRVGLAAWRARCRHYFAQRSVRYSGGVRHERSEPPCGEGPPEGTPQMKAALCLTDVVRSHRQAARVPGRPSCHFRATRGTCLRAAC
jgi:hypothetical protein